MNIAVTSTLTARSFAASTALDICTEPMPEITVGVRIGVALVTVEKTHDELWKDLFGVLKRTIDIVTPRDDYGQMEGFMVGLDHTLRSSFGCGVRIAWS